MKRKKGFIFIETIVVVAVLTVSLLMTYSAFSSSVVKENIRIRYNDSAYMYRTYYFSRFLRNFDLSSKIQYLEETGAIYTSLVAEENCDAIIFYNSEENNTLCNKLLRELYISNVYLTKNDLSSLAECKDFNGECSLLAVGGKGNNDFANYLKTVGGYGKDGYRIIIEYAECKDGSETCDEKTYYYTTLSLGEIE